jgi:hypothetical protein
VSALKVAATVAETINIAAVKAHLKMQMNCHLLLLRELNGRLLLLLWLLLLLCKSKGASAIVAASREWRWLD